MRIGYLGGSFDPVHYGHLAMAEACLEGARLDRVVLVVAGSPPHKLDRTLAGAHHRVAMARIAAEGNPALEVDRRETMREGPSFTIDTVREIRAELGRGHEPVWLIGADSLPEITSWRDAPDLVKLVQIVTAARPGHDLESALAGLAPALGDESVARLSKGVVPMPLLDISSTDIRARVRDGRSTRYLLPDGVRTSIARGGLDR